MPQGFDPRRDALSREYRYITAGNYDIPALANASRLLEGIHDFSNFATPDKERTGVCRIGKIEIHAEKEFTVMDIRADHFLWHMVRKIASAMKLIANGERDMKWLEKMLNPCEYSEGLDPAPAFGLMLKDVEYRGINWSEDEYAMKKISKILEEQCLWHAVMAKMLEELKESMDGGVC